MAAFTGLRTLSCAEGYRSKNFKASGNSASAELNIKGEKVTLVVFKRTGVSKVLLAIVPDDFKLSAFLPIPSGTPADGIKPALPR